MIKPPTRHISDADRAVALEEALDRHLAFLIDQYVTAGYGTVETIDAMKEVLEHRRKCYDEDPDPAEDTYIPEPANDWPSA